MQQFLVYLLYAVLAFTSTVLIGLVLIQRGKGGGLAGAFGGAGGSSAFGTKAGDVFTKVTMILAAVWISLNMLLVVVSNRRTSAWGPAATSSKSEKSDLVPLKPGESLDLPGLKGDLPKTTTEPAAPAASTTTTPSKLPEALPDPAKAAPK